VNSTPPKTKAPFVNRIFISFLFICFIQYTTFMSANAQIVRFIHNAYQAEYYIFETKDSSAANYFVFKTANPAEALKEGVWFFVDDPLIYRDKAIKLHRVKSPAEADLIVYYVRKPIHAGKAKKR
jgi:hypothetical protein